jgi:ATP-dependent DNA helicase RecG
VQLLLKGGPANPALTRFIIEHDVPGRRLTLDQILILNEIETNPGLGIGRASTLIQRAPGPTRAVLDRLVEAGVLEVQLERREPVYYFSSATLSAMGRMESSTVADPRERERLILEHVETHGRITRSQAADLCQIEAREARGVLERLVRRGELVVRGERRGSFYERWTDQDRSTEVMTERS